MTFTDQAYRDAVNNRFKALCEEFEKKQPGFQFEKCLQAISKSEESTTLYAIYFDLYFKVKAHCETIIETYSHIETRLSALEACGIKYMGVWQRAAMYQKGMVVTHRGCAWIALGQVEGARPGEADNWQLMVKAGSDATRTDKR